MNQELLYHQAEQLKQYKNEITRFMMMYKFAIAELETKVEILKEEFHLLHDYNPIEHSSSRIKSFKSIVEKVYRKKCELTFPSLKKNIHDIAGLRITCSFISDIYRISEMLQKQSDLTVLEVKDYIQNPKSNGYQSLHLIVEVPVFISDRCEPVCVEVQIRTIAMDFWASLEHKIYYKYNKSVPSELLIELKEAADTAIAMDRKMERLHNEVTQIKKESAEDINEQIVQLLFQDQNLRIPPLLMQLIMAGQGTEK